MNVPFESAKVLRAWSMMADQAFSKRQARPSPCSKLRTGAAFFFGENL